MRLSPDKEIGGHLQMSRGKVMDISYTSAGGDALNQSKYEEKESE